MKKSYKFRIYPNKLQQHQIEKTFGCCRFVYNWALDRKIKLYQIEKKNISDFDLIKELTQLKQQKEFWWLNEISITALQQSIINMEIAFKMFFKRLKKGQKFGFPKFKLKKNKQTFKVYYPKIDFENNKIWWSEKIGWIKARGLKYFEGKKTEITISKTKTNKYFVSILVEDGKELPIKPLITPETTLGIDLGLTNFVTLSDGRKIENPKYLKKYEDKLEVLQRRASKKKLGSKNRAKINLKVAKVWEKITNLRSDFLHKLAYQLTHENQVGTIICEDLDVVNMQQSRWLANGISDVSWSEFLRQLQYKSDWYGKNFIKVDPRNTSKTCNNCGWVNKDLKYEQVWVCNICGKKLDRDLNAALNIKQSGLGKSVEPVEILGNKTESMKQELCIN